MRFSSGAIGTFMLSDQATSPWAWELGTGGDRVLPRTAQGSIRFMGIKGLGFSNLTLWHHGDDPPDWNHLITQSGPPRTQTEMLALQIAHFAEVIAGRESHS